MVGGGLQVAGGWALSATGLGAVIGVPVMAHGAADVWQGFAALTNAIAGKEVLKEVNFMEQAYTKVGYMING